MHMPLLRGLRLRGERQERHAEHRHPDGAGHRQLRAAHRTASPSEVVVDDRGRARGVRYFDANDQPQRADRPTSSSCPAAATETAAAAAELQVEAVSQRRGQPQRLGGPQPAGPRLHRRRGLFERGDLRRRRPRREHRHLRFQPRQRRAWAAAAMLANEFIRLPYLFAGMRPPGAPRWGQAHKDFQRQLLQAQPSPSGPGRRRCRSSTPASGRPEREGPLGHPRRAPLRPPAPARHRDRRASSPSKAEAWLKEAGAVKTWRSRRPGR